MVSHDDCERVVATLDRKRLGEDTFKTKLNKPALGQPTVVSSRCDGRYLRNSLTIAPLNRQLLLAAAFLTAFVVSDGSSKASQMWEGVPPSYLPVGLSLALLLGGDPAMPR